MFHLAMIDILFCQAKTKTSAFFILGQFYSILFLFNNKQINKPIITKLLQQQSTKKTYKNYCNHSTN